MKHKISPDKMQFMAEEENIKVNLFKDEELISTFSYKPALKLKNLRDNKNDDYQAIVSVHESGHAVLSIVLFDIIPNSIYSILSDKTQGDGLTTIDFEREYISKTELTGRIALLMGGYAAEKMIFGDEHITSGNEDDIAKATTFTNHMLKRAGFGKIPVAYHVKDVITCDYVHDEENQFKKVSEEYLESGLKLAEKVLNKNKSLLLKLADYLNSHQKIDKEGIEELINDIPVTKEDVTMKFKEGYYKNRLAGQIQGMKEPSEFAEPQVLAQWNNRQLNNAVEIDDKSEYLLNKRGE